MSDDIISKIYDAMIDNRLDLVKNLLQNSHIDPHTDDDLLINLAILINRDEIRDYLISLDPDYYRQRPEFSQYVGGVGSPASSTGSISPPPRIGDVFPPRHSWTPSSMASPPISPSPPTRVQSSYQPAFHPFQPRATLEDLAQLAAPSPLFSPVSAPAPPPFSLATPRGRGRPPSNLSVSEHSVAPPALIAQLQANAPAGIKRYNHPLGGPRWVAYWKANGKQQLKSFSVKTFGEEQAYQLAVKTRHNGIANGGRSVSSGAIGRPKKSQPITRPVTRRQVDDWSSDWSSDDSSSESSEESSEEEHKSSRGGRGSRGSRGGRGSRGSRGGRGRGRGHGRWHRSP